MPLVVKCDVDLISQVSVFIDLRNSLSGTNLKITTGGERIWPALSTRRKGSETSLVADYLKDEIQCAGNVS